MDNSRLHDAILTLYRGCRDVSLAEFKGWAMEVARKAVAFDSGIWVTSDIVSDDVSSQFLFHQPREMMENYARTVRISGDPLAQAALANPSKSIVLNQMHANPSFPMAVIEHVVRYGMINTTCTAYISPITRVITFVSFYRANPSAPFSDDDQETHELLVPHLIEAMRINLFSWLSTSKVYAGNALAVCDSEGRLYETTPRFPELLHATWPDWSGPRLNLPFASLAEPGETRWTEHGLKFLATPCQDLFLVSAAAENLLDRLSPRQLEIAQMLAKGRRYKDIARDLGISPSTVTNHVNQIYARLDIDRREDLVRLVLEN